MKMLMRINETNVYMYDHFVNIYEEYNKMAASANTTISVTRVNCNCFSPNIYYVQLYILFHSHMHTIVMIDFNLFVDVDFCMFFFKLSHIHIFGILA